MRFIDADALMEKLQEFANDDWNKSLGGVFSDAVDTCIDFVENAETIEAVQVVHGEWVNGKCSNCGEYIPTDTRIDFVDEEDCAFCYSCGADMRKKV